jgi:ribulose kinase
VGKVDAHITAAAADAVHPGQMVAVTGTSTCHIMNGTAVREYLTELAATQHPGQHGLVALDWHSGNRSGRRVRSAPPDPAAAAVYGRLYVAYVRLHDHFGRGDDVKYELRDLRREVLAR